MIRQEFLERKLATSGRSAANNNLFHSGFIHEFLCPLDKNERTHSSITELKYSMGKFKSSPVKYPAEMGLWPNINSHN